MRILSVVGARPNFMKLAPVDRELAKRPGVEHVIVHTGQHYDPEMSAAFFEQLWIPPPDYHLDVGPGSHAPQTARVMQPLAPTLPQPRPAPGPPHPHGDSPPPRALPARRPGPRAGHGPSG